MAEEVGVYLTADYEQRTTCMPSGGKFACFECGITSRFRGDSQFTYQKIGGDIKKIGNVVKRAKWQSERKER